MEQEALGFGFHGKRNSYGNFLPACGGNTGLGNEKSQIYGERQHLVHDVDG